jgi:hypothetical protein
MQMDQEKLLANGYDASEMDQRNPDEPEMKQDVLDEFLKNPAAFVKQTNAAIRTIEDLYASLCYAGITAPDAYIFPQRVLDPEGRLSAGDIAILDRRGCRTFACRTPQSKTRFARS